MTQQPGPQHGPSFLPSPAAADGTGAFPAGTQAILAPLKQQDLVSFLVDPSGGRVLAATAQADRLGLSAGRPAPEAVSAASRRLAHRSIPGFARLQLPGLFAPRLFRFAALALPEGRAVLFADPAACAPGAAAADPVGPALTDAPRGAQEAAAADAPEAAPSVPSGLGRNVVPLRSGSLSPQESSAFREIARTLAAAIEDWPKTPLPGASESDVPAPESPADILASPADATDLLDRLPVALLVQQDGILIHANRTFLGLTGWQDLASLVAAGGLDAVMTRDGDMLQALKPDGGRLPIEARLVAAPFLGRPALIHAIRPLDDARNREARAAARRSALDMVPWAVFLLEGDGTIRLANRAAADRLGFPAPDLAGEPFTIALAPQDRAAAVAALDRVAGASDAEELDITLRDRDGGLSVGHAAVTRAGEGDRLLCVVVGPARNRTAADRPLAGPEADDPQEPAHEHALPRLAGRLRDSLGAPFATLREAHDGLPPAARSALDALAATLDDLTALATPRPDLQPEAAAARCDFSVLVRDAIRAQGESARRRGVTLRLDAAQAVPAQAPEPDLARLVRLMLEEAIAATPAGGSVAVSVFTAVEEGARACLKISDGGATLDELDIASATDPLAARTPGDRFAAAGRPLRLARMTSEAESLGGSIRVEPGHSRGMIIRLAVPA